MKKMGNSRIMDIVDLNIVNSRYKDKILKYARNRILFWITVNLNYFIAIFRITNFSKIKIRVLYNL